MNTLIVVLSAFLISCSLLKADEIDEPKVKVNNVAIESMSFSETVLGFDLAVDNPNPVSFDVQSLSYQLVIDGKKVSNSDQKINKKIAAKKITHVKVPLTLSNTEFLTTIGQLVQREKTPYKIKGTVKIGVLPIPFEKEGVLDPSEWVSGEE